MFYNGFVFFIFDTHIYLFDIYLCVYVYLHQAEDNLYVSIYDYYYLYFSFSFYTVAGVFTQSKNLCKEVVIMYILYIFIKECNISWALFTVTRVVHRRLKNFRTMFAVHNNVAFWQVLMCPSSNWIFDFAIFQSFVTRSFADTTTRTISTTWSLYISFSSTDNAWY